MTSRRVLDAYHFHEDDWESYEELYKSFEHDIPAAFNVATYVCDRWATDQGRVALYAETEDGEESVHTFRDLRDRANRLANYLESVGVGPGDRVAVTGTQKPETLVTMLATWKVGAISVPVSAMDGSAGLSYRLNDAGATVFVVDESNLDVYRGVQADLETIETTLIVDAAPEDAERAFDAALADQSAEYVTVETSAEVPALIVYTSGTTGDPKGVVHAHQVLPGQLPGFVFKHMNMEVADDDVIWVLAEWSWIGLVAFVLPALFYGRPVVGYARTSFEPESVFRLIEKYEVTLTSLSPTVVRMLQDVTDSDQYELDSIRVLSSGSEKVGESVREWLADVFDDPAVNVGYGQTECVLPTGECVALDKQRPGSIGVPVPGQEVRILDPETGKPTVATGESGEIGIRYRDNPVCLLEYWNRPAKTDARVQGDWLRTGDLGRIDEDGYVVFHSRKDDVIISAGYRMGPEEIEDALADHPAVADAGVIGVPDDARGEIPKAFVELTDNGSADDTFVEELQSHVKDILAKYEYPREIELLEELPRTTSNKIERSALGEMEGIDE